MQRSALRLAPLALFVCIGAMLALNAAPARAQDAEKLVYAQKQVYSGEPVDLRLPPMLLEQNDPKAKLTLDEQIFIARIREQYPDFYHWLRRQPGTRKPILDMREADFQRFRTAFAKWFDARGPFSYSNSGRQALVVEEFAYYFWNLMRDSGGGGD